ncbi:hypothetical protein [Geomicrobium sediminis]|uniref:Uncharacterized protein n=1 Tax=Geomicrobium sediminis TaxID=1347788 RepID=A0ABS2PBH6_9BACL|nr:hypothetical protein [Geomicrobium sediminis]MBM7632769.1 hypothetical protein [Geomicrobium sediminis]
MENVMHFTSRDDAIMYFRYHFGFSHFKLLEINNHDGAPNTYRLMVDCEKYAEFINEQFGNSEESHQLGERFLHIWDEGTVMISTS